MGSFWRFFRCILPQWHRIIFVVTSAFVIAVLLGLSLATIVPLLKVVIGEEGLHGWIDRSVCKWRYGVDFYVPETVDLLENDDSGIAYYLRVTKVGKKGPAGEAGLENEDKIVGAGTFIIQDPNSDRFSRNKLLEELATTKKENITLQIRRAGNLGINRLQKIEMDVPEVGRMGKAAQYLAGFVKREQGKSAKVNTVIFLIIAMIIVTIIRCIATFYQKYLGEKIVQIAIAGVREDMVAHVMIMPAGFFASKGTSDTVHRMIRDINQSTEGVKLLLGKALREPMTALVMLGIAFLISWKLSVIFLAMGPLAVGLGALLGKKIKKATKKSLMISAKMLGKLDDIVKSLRVVKVYNQQEYERKAYSMVNRKLLKRMLKVTRIDVATGPMLEVLGMLAGSAAILVGVHWVVYSNMQASSFFLLIITLGMTAESVRKTSDIWNKIQMSNAAAERVFEVIDQPVEKEKPNACELEPIKNEIEFRDIVFSYPGSDKPVLNRVNLKISAGHNIAIVGPNGSGKTTLANLIPRFYDPDSGKILIDGKDIADVTLHSLRSQIAMVTQEVVTFNDTIAANIAYGRLGATKEEIIEAAKRAYAHEFIADMPDGYDSMIGEHGAGLSGGQLQRIVIARAILKNPTILIFDEATSQVDADSEAKIHKAIEDIMKDRTSIIIAHRFSTIVSADVIVVMDNGQIISQGHHDDLMKKCPLYQNLYKTQLLK